MAAPGGNQVYATLLLSDSYLPGALVLAHSLRDAGTAFKLAVLVTLDSVSANSIAQLRTVYDYIFPVPRIHNASPANLHLMNRADLHSAFTKINLWKLLEFSKIVYIDADVVAYRAPDELFNISQPFAAAPDIGWPDLFNTGVMVLTPNMGDYYAMMAMAERGISFDGADQGLINMHFGNRYHRLSFTYNVTPSAHYQYVPAYRHYQSSINMVHFIGSNKPWFSGRDAPHGTGPFDEMVGRWWAVYDRHYRAKESASQKDSGLEYVQYFTKGEFRPRPAQEQLGTEQQVSEHHTPHDGGAPPPEPKAEPAPIPMHNWDAQRQPPPADSKPEAMNFPSTHYEMSQDTTPFVPPERYPSPPRNMWYEVPKEPPAPSSQPPPEIFPWERHRPPPMRSFVGEQPEPSSVPEDAPSWGEPRDEHSVLGSVTTDAKSEPTTPTTPTAARSAPLDPWTSFTRVNAWDEVPEIERYVEGLQGHRRGKSQSSTGRVGTSGSGDRTGLRLRGLKLTDFPTEAERPSLPVTPAPVRRPSFWSGGDSDTVQGEEPRQLPEAEGVPTQSEWDPMERLQHLARRQSEALLQQFGSDTAVDDETASVSREIPSRPLPFGSGDIKSPTFVAQSAPGGVLSPQPVKGEATTSILRNMSGSNLEPDSAPKSSSIPEPSYTGPGTAWEKGEAILERETPLLPTEEERDVLDT